MGYRRAKKAFQVQPLSKRELVEAVLNFHRDTRPLGTIQYQSMKLIKCYMCGDVQETRHTCHALVCEGCWETGHQQCFEKTEVCCTLCGRGNHTQEECMGREEIEQIPEILTCVRCRKNGHFDCGQSN